MNITDEFRREVALAYGSGVSGTECSLRYGVDKSCVYDWCRKFGIEVRGLREARRIYTYNDAAFDMSCPERSYWLGFLLADGCISQKSRGSLVLSVALQERDRLHLEKLRDFVGSTAPLGYSNKTSSVSLVVPSDRICNQLIKRGCTPRKSLTLEFPPEGLFYRRHFVRGYFDGDGSVNMSSSRYHQANISFVGTEKFLLGLQDVLYEDAYLHKNKLYPHITSKALYLAWTGRGNVRKLYDYLYSDGGVYLERKKAKFEEILG